MTTRYVIDEKNSFKKKIGNALHQGETCYRREDGKPLTSEDEEYFKKIDLGQMTRICLGGECFTYIVLKWENDSSG